LEKARALGDYLLVGVYNDGVCNHYRGGSHPVLNLNERVLSVLACKWVDDVILDPPYFLTQEMIAALSISVVVAGRVTESIEREGSNKDSGGVNSNGSRQHRSNSNSSSEGNNVYAAAADAGILKVVDSGSTLTMSQVLSRIKTNAERLEAKVIKRKFQRTKVSQTKKSVDFFGLYFACRVHPHNIPFVFYARIARIISRMKVTMFLITLSASCMYDDS